MKYLHLLFTDWEIYGVNSIDKTKEIVKELKAKEYQFINVNSIIDESLTDMLFDYYYENKNRADYFFKDFDNVVIQFGHKINTIPKVYKKLSNSTIYVIAHKDKITINN